MRFGATDPPEALRGLSTRMPAVLRAEVSDSIDVVAAESAFACPSSTNRPTPSSTALVGALDLRLFGGLTKLRSDGLVRVEFDPGDTVVAVRDDEAWEAGADLGYTFRKHLRIGAAASYVERRSTIDDFGIDGFLVGGTITFVP